MTSSIDIINQIEENFNNFRKPISELSKTDNGNVFIENDTYLIDWDEISKSYNFDESSSVDAIDYSFNSGELILYFFEFKNYDLYDTFFDAKKQLETYINDLDQCVFSCCYPKNLEKLKKD